MIESIIFVIISLTFSILGIFHVIFNLETYRMEKLYLAVIFFYLINEVLILFFFNMSHESIFSLDISLVFWKISLAMRIIKLTILNSIHSYVLFKTQIRYLPLLINTFLGTILLNILLIPNIYISYDINGYRMFYSINPFLNACLLSFHINIIIFGALSQIFGRKNISYAKVRILFDRLTFILITSILMYVLFYFIQSYVLEIVYSIMFLVYMACLLYVIVFRFNFFTVVTNKIYDFIIFHRSGVLLFSYNFDTGQEIDDSILKGSILIGINHILANFINEKDKLNLLQMRDRDIIFDYNNQFGYALLLLVRHKSKTIEKSVKLFMKDFKEKYFSTLEKINKKSMLIDVSEFRQTKSLLLDYFKSFLVG